MPSFPRRWNVSGAELIAETFSSRIWKVVRDDGTTAIIKDLKPFDDVADELRGKHLLRWLDGRGAVRLLGTDGKRMLLEYAGERHLTEVLDKAGDTAATEIAADVMARLHAPSDRPAPTGLQKLRQRFVALFRVAEAERKAGSSGLYAQAAAVAQELLDDARDIRPLHGDLHHENIIESRRGWLAIDPKGVLGDPCFDAANMFFNPLDRDALCKDPGRIAGMAAIFHNVLMLDPRRVLDHAFAYGCLSAAWHAEDGNDADEERELSVAAAVRAVRLSF
ncbi:3'-kinase [Mesorhizobium sp. Root554]|uniref:aminoglycoside phosphotransferase family protein n=1 Tax=unclassified Mesorhizobium TaxID=325217 RepID=UPI0006F79EEE|nr:MULTISPECIES: aminoglycoside phosphotransferase family protein [unclassified Mesorhizobium]KQZ13332.1 3'-kinase [Mesorhizobium sp. Root1471]KQZ35845.1 3'-kinase [Mesorhizobium sp. Root554]